MDLNRLTGLHRGLGSQALHLHYLNHSTGKTLIKTVSSPSEILSITKYIFEKTSQLLTFNKIIKIYITQSIWNGNIVDL